MPQPWKPSPAIQLSFAAAGWFLVLGDTESLLWIVTEYGVAQLRGKTAKQRCQSLIGIAHPDFRSELREVAKKMKLL